MPSKSNDGLSNVGVRVESAYLGSIASICVPPQCRMANIVTLVSVGKPTISSIDRGRSLQYSMGLCRPPLKASNPRSGLTRRNRRPVWIAGRVETGRSTDITDQIEAADVNKPLVSGRIPLFDFAIIVSNSAVRRMSKRRQTYSPTLQYY